MRKAVKVIAAVTGRVCFIGFSIQIVAGLLWMLCNFTGFQRFGESFQYVEISKNFLCDEYVSILYPVLLLFARGIEDSLHIPYYCVMYLLQLFIALYAAHVFLQAMHPTDRLKNLWGSLVMLTFPLAMQCHLAILPESLTSSVLLLEFTWLWRAVREGEELRSHHLIKIVPFWLVSALLEPEYLYLGAIPVVIVFLYGVVCFGKKEPRQIVHNLIIVASFAGIIVGMNDLTQVEGVYGRVHQSLNAALFSRFSWSTADKTYEDWPEEVKRSVDEEMVRETSFYADNMFRIAGEAMEKYSGVERAEKLFGEVAWLSYARYRGQILHEMAWDVAGYGFAPVISELMLEKRGYDSYTLRNYELMLRHTPVLTTYYFHYSNWWFAVGVVLAGLLQLILWIRDLVRRHEKRGEDIFLWRKVFFWGTLIVSGICMAGWYTIRGGGMFDYKKTIVISCLWIAWVTVTGEEAIAWEE
ncbi:MAG: hypothetical protein J1E64_03680 [Acetatifactor sp.]|nr:hypothetical protein [Acetatifactor sp.]